MISLPSRSNRGRLSFKASSSVPFSTHSPKPQLVFLLVAERECYLLYLLDSFENEAGNLSLFFILLFNALLGFSEVTASFHGRSILAKHKSFAMYRPSAVVLAQVLADFPIFVAQVTVFLLPIYFMTGLRRSGSAFFTLWIITYVVTLSLTSFFRFIGFSFSCVSALSFRSGDSHPISDCSGRLMEHLVCQALSSDC